MESFVDKIKQWGETAKNTWSNLSLNQKVLFGGIVLLILVAIVIITSSVTTENPYQVLYTGLDDKDASAVVDKLDEMKIKYKLEDNGTTIAVPADVKDSTRLKLAAENIPRGESGFELFEQSSFGETQTDKKVKYQAALQGELARSIQSLDKVKAAKVNLALPEETLFSDNQLETKASVVINTKDDQKLTATEVQAITNLVANSVKDLKPENVVIVDQNGNLVSDDLPLDGKNTDVVKMQLAMKRAFEKEKEEAIQTMLDKVLGKDNSVVRVNAELDFNDREQMDERFTHDPEGPFVVSEHIKKDSGTTTSVAQPGIPGTDTNIPQYQEVDTQGGTSTWDKSEKTVNYDINRTETITRFALGDVQYDYLTASVFINRTGTENANIGDSEEEKIEKIRSIVATACGLRENRGDENVRLEENISVAFIDFYTKPEPEAAPQGFWQKFAATPYAPWILAFMAVLLIVLVWLLITRGVKRTRERELDEFETIVDETIDIEDIIDHELTPEEKERQKIREEVERLIDENPENASQVVKVWLLEDTR